MSDEPVTFEDGFNPPLTSTRWVWDCPVCPYFSMGQIFGVIRDASRHLRANPSHASGGQHLPIYDGDRRSP